jgi:metallopeptidase MepB
MISAFKKPTAKKPTLLKHFDLTLLFHELGHGIHELVSKTTYAKLHGTNGPVDFGEGPSQMLENYCWVPSVLKDLGQHYTYMKPEFLEAWKLDNQDKEQPPEKMEDEMLTKLIRARNAHRGIFELSNLHLALFDLRVYDHETHQDAFDFNVPLEFLRIHEDLIPIPDFETLGKGSDWNHGYTMWTHPMHDEYSAGYYSYM